MSYTADHMAWQQRVAQEFKAQQGTPNSQYSQYAETFADNGQYYNYPDLINYLQSQDRPKKTAVNNSTRCFGQKYNLRAGNVANMDDVGQPYFEEGLEQHTPITRKDLIRQSRDRLSATKQTATGSRAGSRYNGDANSQYGALVQDITSQYGYSGKRKVIYKVKSNKRATSSSQKIREGPSAFKGQEDTKSILSRSNIQRFNETTSSKGGVSGAASQKSKSQLRSYVSRRSQVGVNGRVLSQKSSVFSKQSFAKKKQQLAERQEIEAQQKYQEAQEDLDNLEIKDPEPSQAEIEEMVDKVLELSEKNDQNENMNEQDDNLTSVSQVIPTQSQISKMTGQTYISELQKQLEDEKNARHRLEDELSELKKVSSEILSHLSEIKADQQNRH